MAAGVRSPVTRHLGTALLSLFSAALLWYLAAGQEKTEASFIVPVELTNVPESVALEGSSLEFIHVRLKGSRGVIQELDPQELRVNLDLRSLRPGDNLLPVAARDIRIPRGVELINISPPYLSLRAAARRLVPVRAHVRGRPADGYEVVSAQALPGKVYIIGPPDKVATARGVDTLPVSVRGLTDSAYLKADLIPPDPDLRLLELKPTEVAVEIRGERRERTLRDVPVTPPPGLLVRPDRVKVTVAGPFNLVDPLGPADLAARVAGGDTARRRVTVAIPDGVILVGVSPPTVEVTSP